LTCKHATRESFKVATTSTLSLRTEEIHGILVHQLGNGERKKERKKQEVYWVKIVLREEKQTTKEEKILRQ